MTPPAPAAPASGRAHGIGVADRLARAGAAPAATHRPHARAVRADAGHADRQCRWASLVIATLSSGPWPNRCACWAGWAWWSWLLWLVRLAHYLRFLRQRGADEATLLRLAPQLGACWC
jgi:hypothetical protein